MARKLQSAGVIPLTRKVIDKHRTLAPLRGRGERGLRDWRLASLYNLAVNDKFILGVWVSAFCKEDGINYGTNGNHSSLMLSALPDNKLPKNAHICQVHYICDTYTDVVEIWKSFDPAWSSRNQRDVNRGHASAISELDSVPDRLLDMTVSASIFVLDPTKARNKDNGNVGGPAAARAAMLSKRIDFAVWLNEYLFAKNPHETKDTRYLMRQPIINAMMLTWDVDKEATKKFWLSVRDGDAVVQDQTRQLQKTLMQAIIRNTICRGGAKDKTKMTGMKMYAICIKRWNHWRNGIVQITEVEYRVNAPLPKAK